MSSEKEETTGLQELDTPKTVCADDDGKKSADLALLQAKLESERDGRKEERFYWIFALTIALDMVAFQWMGWGQAFLVFLLELPALILLANYLGVDLAVDLLKGLLKKVLDNFPKVKND